jgi:hypothetical protein
MNFKETVKVQAYYKSIFGRLSDILKESRYLEFVNSQELQMRTAANIMNVIGDFADKVKDLSVYQE